MRKFYSILFLALFGVALHAQDTPNRLLVRDKLGNLKGFLTERVDSIFFAGVEERVAADIEFKGYDAADGGTVTVAVTRTPQCQAFRIDCLPTNSMAYLATDEAIANYFDNKGGTLYNQDFTEGKMSGFDFEFKENSSYSLITVGYDQYGIACSASRADFTTPRSDLVGNPSVAWEVKSVGGDNLTMSFTPNADTGGYAICLFEKGQAEAQFNMWGPMFGFANMGDMVRQFSQVDHTAYYENTWTGLAPGTDYEVYIQAWDVNGTYADMIVAPVTTEAQGGQGLAEVSIRIGDFGGDATNGYYQYVTYTPNENVSLYRAMIIEKSYFDTPDWGEEGILDYLKADNPNDPYWNMYSAENVQWNADPDKEYIAFAIGKNINGEWGTLARLDFSTPSRASAAAKAKAVPGKIMRGVSTYSKNIFRMVKPFPASGKIGLRLTNNDDK